MSETATPSKTITRRMYTPPSLGPGGINQVGLGASVRLLTRA